MCRQATCTPNAGLPGRGPSAAAQRAKNRLACLQCSPQGEPEDGAGRTPRPVVGPRQGQRGAGTGTTHHRSRSGPGGTRTPGPGGAVLSGGGKGRPRPGPRGPGSLSPQPCRRGSRAGAPAPHASTVGHLPAGHLNRPPGSGDEEQRLVRGSSVEAAAASRTGRVPGPRGARGALPPGGGTLRSLWMMGGFCLCMCCTALHTW